MMVLYITFIILTLAILIATFIIVTLDNFENYVIRINEAEANIEAILNKRFDLLNKSTDIIKEYINTEEDILKTISTVRSQKLDNFELDKKLYDSIQEFHDYSDRNIELKEDDDYTKIEIDLIESESEILALKEYYNDIITKYNNIVNKAPFNIVAKIKKYSEKDSFEIEDHFELINSLK